MTFTSGGLHSGPLSSLLLLVSSTSIHARPISRSTAKCADFTVRFDIGCSNTVLYTFAPPGCCAATAAEAANATIANAALVRTAFLSTFFVMVLTFIQFVPECCAIGMIRETDGCKRSNTVLLLDRSSLIREVSVSMPAGSIGLSSFSPRLGLVAMVTPALPGARAGRKSMSVLPLRARFRHPAAREARPAARQTPLAGEGYRTFWMRAEATCAIGADARPSIAPTDDVPPTPDRGGASSAPLRLSGGAATRP